MFRAAAHVETQAPSGTRDQLLKLAKQTNGSVWLQWVPVGVSPSLQIFHDYILITTYYNTFSLLVSNIIIGVGWNHRPIFEAVNVGTNEGQTELELPEVLRMPKKRLRKKQKAGGLFPRATY